MGKEKVSLIYRIRHWFSYHPWLKILSFILAAMVWLYVKGEISMHY
jgi:hypothetical protein